MRRPILLLTLVLLALLGTMAAKSLLIALPTRTDPPAQSGQFDEQRAKAELAFILGDQRPHPADTLEDDQVRARLVTVLSGMGLKPVVRDQLACNELYKARGVSCARVRNVIALLGPPAGKAVLLNAHYDSTPVGPGAADDGIGVATLLEVARNLKDQPLKRPVILLFNEGEERGLIGARAFLADPLSRNVDSLINLEARGVRGPVNMFETSEPNGAAIALYSRAVARPVANSLSTDVYRLMPNYTDVNSFAERGWLTLNLAPIGNETRYHSAGDELAALDPRTLQHMGDQTLALAQALASGDVPQARGKRIFMDVSGLWLVLLPFAPGLGLLGGLVIAFGFLAWRRGGAARGAALVLGTLVGSAALSWLALALIGALRHGMFWRAQPVWTTLAVYASVMLVAVVLLASVARRTEVRQLRAVFWLSYLIIGAIIGFIAPGGIVFFLFPPLIAFIGIVAGRWWPPAERAASLAAVLFLYLTWGEMLALLEELLNGGPMWLFAPLGALIVVPVLIEAKSLIDSPRLRPAAAVAGLLALAGWAASAAAPAYSADRQQRFAIEHVTDVAHRRSHWVVVNDGKPLPTAYSAAGEWTRGKLPYSDRPRWIAPVPPIAGITAPAVEAVTEPTAVEKGKPRIVTILLHANGAQNIRLIAPEGADIRAAGVDGFVRPIDRSVKNEKYVLDCFGRSCDGLTMHIRLGGSDPVEFTLVGSSQGLPPIARPLVKARPRDARPQYLPDATITLSRVWL